jgi:putative flavoprotein involved in K+ transport
MLTAVDVQPQLARSTGSHGYREPMVLTVDVAVVGGGQAGLATAYHLRRAGLRVDRDVVVLDAEQHPGGAWQHTWEGLRLFSPATYSSLPGWMMPPWDDARLGFPPRDHVIDYLTRYEERYGFDVRRPHRVDAVERAGAGDRLVVRADGLEVEARVVVSATGTWTQPFWPAYPGAREFAGRQLHAVHYRRPDELAGQRVAVVGGGNTGAQVLAEVSTVADTTWFTARPPRFLPDDVDGRALFAAATARIEALRQGRQHAGVAGLGDVVMVDSVRAARERGVLVARPMFARLTADGVVSSDGVAQDVDTVIWCTGFRPALRHLRPLHLATQDGRPVVDGPSGTRAASEPRLHLVGYGDWTGPASATLLGVGRSARAAAEEIVGSLRA